MERILYFDMCAFFVIIALLFSVFYHRMTRGVTNRSFLVAMLACFVTIIFDIGSEVIGMTIPVTQDNLLLDEFFTYGFYVFRHFTALLYLMYLTSLTDSWHKVAKSVVLKVLLFGPYAVILGLLIANPFTGVIFYFNDQLEYIRGWGYYIVYLCAFFYLLYGIYYSW